MSISNHRRTWEQAPSPCQAPRIVAPVNIDGVPAHEVAVEAPLRESTPSTAASHHVSELDIIDHQPFIEPRGDGFVGATSVVSMITDIFHFGGAYVRYSEIPIHIWNLWFEEFGKRFRWLPQHDALVRVNWEKRCKRRLSDTLHKIRKTSSLPQWIAPEHWTEMQQKFNSPSFQKIATSAKRNRAKAGPSHTSSSISFSEHEERERRSKGAEFAYKDLYKRLHMFQDGPKKGEFVSERSRQLLDEVEQIQQRYTPLDSIGSVSSSSLPEEKEIFLEADGGKKKGRVSSLGSEGSAISRSQTSMSSDSGLPQSFEDFRKQMQKQFQKDMKVTTQKLKSNIKKQLETTYKKRDDTISSYLG